MPDVPLGKTILPCRTMSEAPEKPPTEKVQTLAEFLRVVRACGLVEPERLERLVERCRAVVNRASSPPAAAASRPRGLPSLAHRIAVSGGGEEDKWQMA